MIISLFNSPRMPIYSLFHRSLLKNCIPLLVVGDNDFSFNNFILYSNQSNISPSIYLKLLVANVVNMFHVNEQLNKILNYEDKNIFPIVFNFTKYFFDDSVRKEDGNFLFTESLETIYEISQKRDTIVYIIENKKVKENPNQSFFLNRIKQISNISICFENENGYLLKKNLTLDEKDKLYGSDNKNFFSVGRRFVDQLKLIQKNSTQGRSSMLR